MLHSELQSFPEALKAANGNLIPEGEESEQLLFMLDHVPAMISMFDPEMRYLFVNEQYGRVYQMDRRLLLGRHLGEVVGQEIYSRIKSYIQSARAGNTVRFESRLPLEDGEPFSEVEVTFVPQSDAAGVLSGILALLVDITERKRAERELFAVANTDLLTGLANRKCFVTRMAEEIARSERYGSALCLVMADADDFKRINERFGHEGGDRALKCIAEVCAQGTRTVDTVGRLGDDEFALLLAETTVNDALVVTRRIQRTTADQPVDLEGECFHVSLSMGVAGHSAGDDAEALMQAAEEALERAKGACGH